MGKMSFMNVLSTSMSLCLSAPPHLSKMLRTISMETNFSLAKNLSADAAQRINYTQMLSANYVANYFEWRTITDNLESVFTVTFFSTTLVRLVNDWGQVSDDRLQISFHQCRLVQDYRTGF